jgi:hypothetical protein
MRLRHVAVALAQLALIAAASPAPFIVSFKYAPPSVHDTEPGCDETCYPMDHHCPPNSVSDYDVSSATILSGLSMLTLPFSLLG